MISDQEFDVLRNTSLFAGFTDEQLEMVPKVALSRSFAPEDVIIAEGATDVRSLFCVLEGHCDVLVGGEFIRTIEPGGYFGELALLSDGPRSASVVARDEVHALELTRRHLHGLIGGNPDVALAMLAELAHRLRTTSEALSAAIVTSPEAAAAARAHGFAAAHDEEVYGSIVRGVTPPRG